MRRGVGFTGCLAPTVATIAAAAVHVLAALRLDAHAPTDGEARLAAAVYAVGGGDIGPVLLPLPDLLAARQGCGRHRHQHREGRGSAPQPPPPGQHRGEQQPGHSDRGGGHRRVQRDGRWRHADEGDAERGRGAAAAQPAQDRPQQNGRE